MVIKRAFAALLSALLCAGILLFCASGRSVETAAEPFSALRLHVIANSDGDEDQAVKLAVRSAVLKEARARFASREVSNAEEARAILLEMGAELTAAAEKTLEENGMDYGVQLEFGTFAFPDRVYGTKLYPAGDYSALRVILGEGAGRNWWCVMFPPLCIIDEPEAPAEYNDDGTLRFKSFFGELIKLIFG